LRSLCIAGVATLASLGAQAQVAPARQSAEPVVVTATRALSAVPTLRNAIVITREELEASGALSLAEVLQRRAGIELRATGGPGQPQSLFIHGATAAQTLVLVDGLRVGSATVGSTSIEHIPLEMIERVEVVKGTMSSLYGAEAIGGVVQIFTRGKTLPHLFVATGYGSANDRRVSAGLTTEDQGTLVSLSTGARRVNAPSATNPRAGFLYNPDRDPYENAFFNLRASQRLWQGETVEVEAFGTRSRTHFDAGAGDDRSDQSISGAKLTSSTHFMPWWASRLALGEGRDRLVIRRGSPDVLETRQQQVSWINEFATPRGTFLAGVETVRQRVVSDEERTRFTRTHRDTSSAFAAVNESFAGQRVEASVRRDDDDEFGKRNTGSTSYGWEWPSVGRLAATYATGFRAPTFFDLYGPAFEGYTPNPALEPERSKSYELAFRADPAAALQWRVSAFDHRFENLIVYSFIDSTVLNVARARTRGIEASLEATWLGARWRASLTAQRPRDESSGKRLQGRAERYGTLEATRTFGSWTAGVSVLASGPRFDSADEAPASRLGGYAVVDARLRYAIDKRWTAELTATNLGDRRRESAVGYDAPRRGLFLSLRFESF
jgi:vitamin B12 transporter